MLNIIRQEFIFDDPLPTPQCHASTIARLSDGKLAAAWFAGTMEGHEDTLIWLSTCESGIWAAPRPVTPDGGVQHYNPVLFERSADSLLLYYKRGYPIADWHTRVMESTDGGATWTPPRELFPGDTSGGRGPVRSKILRLASGRLLAPASVEKPLPWRCFIDVSDDNAHTWCKRPIGVDAPDAQHINLIQPTLWEHPAGQVHALMRSNQGCIFRSDSTDGGWTWSPARPTTMPNNNSGIDCVRMDNGLIVLACNPVADDWGVRYPLSLYVSEDDGETFRKALDVETEPCPAGYCYPALIADGEILHLTYTWNRRKIAYCRLRG